jgi:hypothetical protein
LEEACNTQAKYYNKTHIPKSYNVRNKVLLSSKNIKLVCPSKKLNHRFLRPFRVIQLVGKQAYKLDIPRLWKKIYPVFHVSLLKSYNSTQGARCPQAVEPVLLPGREEWEVEQVLDERIRKGTREYLVR